MILHFIGEDSGAFTSPEAVVPSSNEGVTVIDLVDAHRLKEIELDKKGWTGYIKGKCIVFEVIVLM